MKHIYKVMTVSALATVIASGSIGPHYAFAAETHTPSSSVQDVQTERTKSMGSLGSINLKQVMDHMNFDMLLSHVPALAIVKQEHINMDGTHAIDASQKENLKQQQQQLQTIAKQWLDTFKPQFLQVNEGMINYTTQFQTYSDILMKAIEEKDTGTFQQVLTKLTAHIHKNKETVDKLIQELQGFQTTITTNQNSFKTIGEQAVSYVASKDESVKEIESVVKELNTELDAYIAEKKDATLTKGIIVGAVIIALVCTSVGAAAIAGGAFTVNLMGVAELIRDASGVLAAIVGLAGVTVADSSNSCKELPPKEQKELTDKLEKIKGLAGNLTINQIAVAGITNLNGQAESLSQHVKSGISSLQAIADTWSSIESNYTSLLQKGNGMRTEDWNHAKNDILMAKNSWKELSDNVKDLYIKDGK